MWFERSKTTGWGLFGGKNGIGPNVIIKSPNGKKENRLKSNSLPVSKGTKITTFTGGGGGFGDPYKRRPEKVLDDLINSFISKKNIKKDYKVILSSNSKINFHKTKELRKKKILIRII